MAATVGMALGGCQVNQQMTRPDDATEAGTAKIEVLRQEIGDDKVEIEWKLTGDRKWVWASAEPDMKLRYAYPLGTSQTHGGKHVWYLTLRLRRFPGTDRISEERIMLGDLPEAKTEDNFLSTYDRPIEFGKEYRWKSSLKESLTVYISEAKDLLVPSDQPLYEVKFLDEEGREAIRGVGLKVLE